MASLPFAARRLSAYNHTSTGMGERNWDRVRWRQRSGKRRNDHWRSGWLPAWPCAATWRLLPGSLCPIFPPSIAANPFLARTIRAAAQRRSNAGRNAVVSVPRSTGPGRGPTRSCRRPTPSGRKQKAGTRPACATRSKVVAVAGIAPAASPRTRTPKKPVAPVTKRKPPAAKRKPPRPRRNRTKANGWPVLPR